MKKEQLNVCIVQSELDWEQPDQNRNRFENWLDQLPADTDLVILPEMFTSGFTMNGNTVGENMQGETIHWLIEIAKQKQSAICGSLVINDKNNLYNRFVFRPLVLLY